jgi:hypothetical protein
MAGVAGTIAGEAACRTVDTAHGSSGTATKSTAQLAPRRSDGRNV